MYLRTIKRKNKDGSVVEYVQLAHNVRHPQKRYPKAEVIHSFGRRDQLDIDGLKRLVASIGRFIELDDSHTDAVGQRPCSAPMKFVGSQSVGGVCLLQAVWEQLQIGACIQNALKRQPLPATIERALFALVAGGALVPYSSGLTTSQVVPEAIFPGQDRSLEERHLNQAVDLLHDHADAIQQAVSLSAASLMSLSLDRVFVGLIPACGPADGGGGFRRRSDAPSQGTITLAVSQAGIPLKCWLLPAPRTDNGFIESVRRHILPWSPGRLVWVLDSQVAGDENLDVLRRVGGAHIVGEKLRAGRAADAALRRKGRFKILGPDLQIKASTIGEGAERRRCVIALHPRQAAIDRNDRERLLKRLRHELERRNTGEKTAAAPGPRLDHALGRYVKILRDGTPKIDMARVRQEEKHDGKYLLISSDTSLPPEAVAWGHKQLLDIERTCRALKAAPVPPAGGRIPDEGDDADMMLLWLTLLLTRSIEVQTGMTWPSLCQEMQTLHVGEFEDRNRRIFQYTEPTSRQKKILRRLRISLPR